MDIFREIWASFAFKEFNGHPTFDDSRDFYSETVQAQKEWIDEIFDNFLRKKIQEADSSYKLKKDLGVIDLVRIASKYYDKEAIFTLVDFILNIAGNIQGPSICWTCNENVDKCIIDYKNGNWYSLKTSENVSAYEVFKYVYEKFQNEIMLAKEIRTLENNFMNYISIPTNSCSTSDTFPSTKNQFALARTLEMQLKHLGIECFYHKYNCYVYAKLEGDKEIPSIGFIAHMDTSEDAKDSPVHPLIISNYNGSDVVYKNKTILKVSENPDLLNHIGETLITTDGNTLLGADDKAGIAEIMGMLEYFQYSNEPHGDIYVVFTPDEEIGKSIDNLDRSIFNPKYAYTVDGEYLGEISYENFNAVDVDIYIKGLNVHPGYAKNKMINANIIATTINSLLPKREVPARTSDAEGFYHLHKMNSTVSEAYMRYLIRDFDIENLRNRINILKEIVDKLNKRYGNCIEMKINERYMNMKKIINQNIEVIEIAKKAIEKSGVKSYEKLIRGGTDGTRLSFEGIPCPNLGAGGHNFHSTEEYITLEDMEKVKDILINIVKEYYLAYKMDKDVVKKIKK